MGLHVFAMTVATAALACGCSHATPRSAAPAPSRSATPSPAPSPSATPSPAPSRTVTGAPSPDELSPRPGLESPAPLGRPTCSGTALTVTDADTLVTTQYRHEVFVLRTSGPACQLQGYPRVSLLGADGRPLAVRTQEGGFGLPAEKPAAVTLSRTTSLSFEVATSRDGACVDATTILATLPGTSTTHRAATDFPVCGTIVGLSPVHRQGDNE